jgi:hypothetical protein
MLYPPETEIVADLAADLDILGQLGQEILL